MFQPVFDVVIGTAPNGKEYTFSGVGLNDASAKELAKIFADLKPKIVEGPPVPNIGSRFRFSETVPFFVFPDGKVRNCGVLATYWIWFGPTRGEQAARDDIADEYMGTELI